MVIRNSFPTTQHVFIDGRHVGQVPSRSSVTLPLELGTHTVTSANSMDPDDDPVSVTETFEAGFNYVYEIVPE